jgi:hypothetical protein
MNAPLGIAWWEGVSGPSTVQRLCEPDFDRAPRQDVGADQPGLKVGVFIFEREPESSNSTERDNVNISESSHLERD